MPKTKDTDAYIAGCTPDIASLMTRFRRFIRERLPGSTEGMQYGVPVFFNAHKVPVIYLFGAADHVNFGFLKFAQMDDPDNLLRGSGKPSKHFEIKPGDPVDTALLEGFIAQCAAMTA